MIARSTPDLIVAICVGQTAPCALRIASRSHFERVAPLSTDVSDNVHELIHMPITAAPARRAYHDLAPMMKAG